MINRIDVYISGPITGIKDRNKKAFAKAEREIKAALKEYNGGNFKVINPVKMGFKLDKRFLQSKMTPGWEDYMRMCIKELVICDLVILLPGWESSEGAVMEKYIAERLKIPCYFSIKDFIKEKTEEV